MQEKNIIQIFVLFLILLLSCGFASAASDMENNNYSYIDDQYALSYSWDMDISDSQSGNENIGFIDDSNGLSVEKSKTVSDSLSDSVSGNTFEDIQTAIDDSENQGIVELNGKYIGNGTPISFSKNLTLEGKGETILDAKGLSGIIHSASENVIFKDIIFVNGVDYAIDLKDNNGNLKDCSIINCSFVNCSASNNHSTIALNGSGSILGCEFNNTTNTIKVYGSGTVSIVDSSFNNNVGYAINSESNAIVKSCNFINNKFNLKNHYFVSLCRNSNISDCIFNHSVYLMNRENNFDVFTGYQLSTLHVCDEVNVINCTFSDSKTNSSGSAIYHLGNGLVIGCTFINDFAGGYFGSVSYIDITSGVVYLGSDNASIINCTFTNCSSFSEGGAIDISKNNCSVINCSFLNCSSNSNGGAIYIGGGTGDNGFYPINIISSNVADCSFVNCSTKEFGGAVYWTNGGLLSNCSFSNCSAWMGGALYVENCEEIQDPCNIMDCRFSDNNGYLHISDNIRNDGIIFLSGNEILSDRATILNSFSSKASILSPVNLVILDNATKSLENYSSFDIFAQLEDDQGNLIRDNNISLFIDSLNKTSNFDNNSFFKFHLNNLSSLNRKTLVSGDYGGVKDLTVKTAVLLLKEIIDPTIDLTYSNNTVIVKLLDSEGKPISGESVSVSVNGVSSDIVMDANGEAKLDVIANSTVKAFFIDDIGSKVTASLSLVEIKEKQLIPAIANATISLDVNKNNTEVIVSLKDLSGKVIKNASLNVLLNGNKKTLTTNASGQAKIGVNGNSTVEVSYTDAKNANATVSSKIILINTIQKTIQNNTVEVPVYVNVTPKRTVTKISYEDMNTTAVAKVDGRVGKYFEVKLVDANGKALANKPVQIGFNGRVYNKTTEKDGNAKLQINLGYEGAYTFAISYLGDDNYTGDFQVAVIRVSKHTPKLTVPSKTYNANAKTKTLTATLKSANKIAIDGKKIKFTVNGKTYTATTNAKGIASVKVSLSKKGTYNFTVKYAGDGMYNAISLKSKLTIK